MGHPSEENTTLIAKEDGVRTTTVPRDTTAPHTPTFLVGHAPIEPVTDTAPIADFDTGYAPRRGGDLPATGAWLEGDDPQDRLFADIGSLELELGGRLPNVRLAYETWGELNTDASNAVLLCHALTGDSHATNKDGTDGWWKEIVGPGKAIDTEKYFVVCPNVLGGCDSARRQTVGVAFP